MVKFHINTIKGKKIKYVRVQAFWRQLSYLSENLFQFRRPSFSVEIISEPLQVEKCLIARGAGEVHGGDMHFRGEGRDKGGEGRLSARGLIMEGERENMKQMGKRRENERRFRAASTNSNHTLGRVNKHMFLLMTAVNN